VQLTWPDILPLSVSQYRLHFTSTQ